MARFHDDGDTLWLEDFGQSKGDLFGQTLLNLQSAREHLGDTCQLGEAEDAAVGDITDVHLDMSESFREKCQDV